MIFLIFDYIDNLVVSRINGCQLERIVSLVPIVLGLRGVNARLFLGEIVWVAKTGFSRHDMPIDLGAGEVSSTIFELKRDKLNFTELFVVLCKNCNLSN